MLSLPNLQYIFYQWVEHLLLLWDFFNTPLQSLVERLPPLSGAYIGLAAAIGLMGVNDLTLLEFMLGAGILIYIGYQFVTWLFNIIT